MVKAKRIWLEKMLKGLHNLANLLAKVLKDT